MSKKQEQKVSKDSDSEEDVIDLCDNENYQVLSALLETDNGENVAEILLKLQKDVHILAKAVHQISKDVHAQSKDTHLQAMSIHQLIQLSVASQQLRKGESEDDDDSEEVDSEEVDSDEETTTTSTTTA